MEKFPTCRGYGVIQAPTDLPIDKWFPMTFHYGKSDFMAVLVTYVKVRARTAL